MGETATGEYFDSFAQEPDRFFVKFLDHFAPSWIQNKVPLQSMMSSFCGHYCIFYSLFKTLGYSMDDIINCFIPDTTVNDMMVHAFVCKYL